MNIKEEHGLVILKPDGVQKGIEEELIKELKSNDIKIVHVSKRQLTKLQVLESFTSDFNMDIYSDYISRSDVIGYLVKGHYAGQKLRDIKQQIRSNYGYTSRNMENLIHTADHGNEYYFQFKQFFPELDIVKYSKFGDMNLRIDGDEQEITNTLLSLSEESNLSWVGIVTSIDRVLKTKEVIRELRNLSFNCIIGVSATHNFNGEILEIIGYLPPSFTYTDYDNLSIEKIVSFEDFAAWINDLGGLMVLGYTSTSKINLLLLNVLKRYMIKGITIYDARRDMRQIEDLEELVEDKAGMLFSGGTAGIVRGGEIALDRAEFEYLTKSFLFEGIIEYE
ncbi:MULTISPECIES: nucleoside-diphosphate kinase [Heyndrickxia]|uniref:nucleoside-diphosphate kinase n=1 Tax=Heyndrickxia TaxID=2837504 RepID=UPI0030F65741